MEYRRSGSLGLQLRDAEQTLWQSLVDVCANRPSARPNTGELIRVAEMLAIAGNAVKHAMMIRRRQRVAEPLHGGHGVMANAEAMVARSTAHRAFTDSHQIGWDVFDVYLISEPGAQRRLMPPFQHGWLCFESVGEKRRLGPIPPGWRSLSDTDLERLLQQAETVPVPRRRRSRPTDPPSPLA